MADIRDTVAHMSSWYEFDEKKMELTFTGEDDEEIVARAEYIVCNICLGKGKYVNPSIDSHGITQEEWNDEWDEDDRRNYLSGRYDVTCEMCQGDRVIPTVADDESKSVKKAFHDAYEQAYLEARERESEGRMGY